MTAKSSPRLIVVPTAMNSLCPDSVLKVSSGTHAIELTNSFVANSYLKYRHISAETFIKKKKALYPSRATKSGLNNSSAEHSLVGYETFGAQRRPKYLNNTMKDTTYHLESTSHSPPRRTTRTALVQLM